MRPLEAQLETHDVMFFNPFRYEIYILLLQTTLQKQNFWFSPPFFMQAEVSPLLYKNHVIN